MADEKDPYPYRVTWSARSNIIATIQGQAKQEKPRAPCDAWYTQEQAERSIGVALRLLEDLGEPAMTEGSE